MVLLLLAIILFLFLEKSKQVYEPDILAIEAHDDNWFTQGFYHEQDGFYVSSGRVDREIFQSAVNYKMDCYMVCAQFTLM